MQCPLCRLPPAIGDAEILARHRRHVDMDVPEALTSLGLYYRDGQYGLVKSATKAVKLFERAVELGNVNAMTWLGFAYEIGEGVKLSKKKASKFYRMAADRRHAAARCNLGILRYENANFDQAVRLFGLAAAQGLTHAEYMLGLCLEHGLGVPTKDSSTKQGDLDEAKRLYALAAAKGYEQAKDRLANLG